MPRLLILSDIHGNLPALEAVLADAKQFAPLDAVLVAGDIITPIYHDSLLRKLRELGAVMIQGNGESSLLAVEDGTAPSYYQTARQFALIRWSLTNVSSADLDFIRILPEQRVFHLPGTDPIRMVHGSPRKINESIFPSAHPDQLANVLNHVDEPVVIFGHTHQPWKLRVDGRLALNPGAVCGPLDGQVGAQYAILEWDGAAWQASLHCIPYDLDAVKRLFVDSGLLDTGYLAKSFLISIYTGTNGAEDFLAYAFDLARRAGFGDLPYIPDPIWEQAGQLFPWPTIE